MPARRTGKRVAVVGSGPAGMACAQQLARAGHAVTLFEKADRIGGLLRYGIPDFKMEKWLIDRRVEQMAAEGVEFRTGVEVGVDVPVGDLLARIRRRGDDRRRRIAARSRSPRPRSRRHPFRDGVPAAAEQARRRRRRGEGGAERHDQRRGQACHRDRRRRYRLGLHRHLEPAGRIVDHAARNPAQAAGAREQGAGLAGLAVEAAHLVLAGRGLRARLGGADQACTRLERPRRGARMRAGRMGCRAPTAAGRCGKCRTARSS